MAPGRLNSGNSVVTILFLTALLLIGTSGHAEGQSWLRYQIKKRPLDEGPSSIQPSWEGRVRAVLFRDKVSLGYS